MLKIEVTSQVESGSYFSKKENRDVPFRDQEAYVHLAGERYPKKMRIRLKDRQPPWPEGPYALSPKSFTVGHFGDLQLAELILDQAKG